MWGVVDNGLLNHLKQAEVAALGKELDQAKEEGAKAAQEAGELRAALEVGRWM